VTAGLRLDYKRERGTTNGREGSGNSREKAQPTSPRRFVGQERR
jgi:hypothetical protein